MRFFKVLAFAGAIVAGALGLAQGGASASPLPSAGAAIVGSEPTLLNRAYHYGRPHVVERHVYRPGRPTYHGFRPGPRVVCRTQIRVVRTPYGRILRRPVEVCTRRY